MVCSKCHANMPDGSTVCTYCQQPVGAPAAVAAVAASPAAVSLPAVREGNYLQKLFSGRMNRLSYFLAPFIMEIMVFISAFILGFIYGLTTGDGEAKVFASLISVVSGIMGFIFGLSFSVRRAHDLGKKWTWLLWSIIPIVNVIILFRLIFERGTQGDNSYGAPPKSGVHIKELFGLE